MPTPNRLAASLSSLVVLSFVIAGCEPSGPTVYTPEQLKQVAHYYWQAMERGEYDTAKSYALPGDLSQWEFGAGFDLAHVGTVFENEGGYLVPVVLKLQDGTEKHIETVLTKAEDEYWVDVEATLARTWRPEAVRLEKELLSEDGFQPDPGDGEVRE